MLNRVPITPNGYQKMQEELSRLLKVDRPKNIRDIAEARAHGDLSENAEYHAAKEQQSFAEGRIAEIERKLSNAQIIDITKVDANGKVVFGATAEIEDIESEKRVTYQIVGEDEASIKEGRISIGSPIARVLIGKEVDDVVTVKAPGGNVDYEIISIKYI